MFAETIALMLLILLCIIGVGLCVFGVGGTFLIAIGAGLYNLILWKEAIPWHILLALLGLAIFGELFQAAITYFGIKRAKLRKETFIGLVLGALALGSLLSFIPIIGTIIGIFIGAVLGVYVVEWLYGRNPNRALTITKTLLMSQGLSIIAKILIAAGQIITIILALK